MQVHVRPFRKDIYDLVDEPSKKTLSDYLISKGHTIVKDKETFDADIVSTKEVKGCKGTPSGPLRGRSALLPATTPIKSKSSLLNFALI